MLVPGTRAFTLLLGALSGLTALSVDMSLPALPRIAEVFGASPDTAQLTLSLFLVGFSVGQLFYGPLSDRFGRRPVLIGGLVLYAAGGLGCALSPSIEWLIACRLLQGLGGCVGRVMGPAIIRDEFSAQKGAQVLSHIMQVVALAPLVAPMIGGVLVGFGDWQSIFWLLFLAGLAIIALTVTQLRETSKYRDPSAIRLVPMARNWAAFLGNRTCLGYLLVVCGVFSGLFSFISGSSFVFIGGFGLSSEVYGVLFGSIAIGFGLGAFVNSRLVRRLAPQRILKFGLAIVVAAGVTLLVLAHLAPGVVGVLAPMTAYVFGMGLVFPNATAAAMEPLPRIAGLASALLGSSQMAVASLVGWLVNRFYDGTPVAMATAIATAALFAGVIWMLVVPPHRPAAA